jgi:MFS family permease
LSDAIAAPKPLVNMRFLLKVSFIAGLGGLLYGFDMGVIAAALIFVRITFNLSPQMEEIVVSIVLVGAMLGALSGGVIADRIGRRATLVWGGIIFIAGSILAPWSPNVLTLIFARALLGIAIGFTSVTAPVYVSELAHRNPAVCSLDFTNSHSRLESRSPISPATCLPVSMPGA